MLFADAAAFSQAAAPGAAVGSYGGSASLKIPETVLLLGVFFISLVGIGS